MGQIIIGLLTLAAIAVGVAIIALIGYAVIGILIWALPFLLAVGVICLVIYGLGHAIFGKK